MAIITKPTITKGQANEFDLSKSDLAVLSKVTSDSYFSDQANWSKVYIEYKSTEGKQIKQVVFDASQTAPKGSFDISEKSKDDFEVQALVIMDFDGGYLKLERGDLTVADFDISLGQVSGGSLSITGINPNYLNSTYLTLSEDGNYVQYNDTRGRSMPVYLSEGIDFSNGGKYYKEITVDKQSNLYVGQFGFRIFEVEPTEFSQQYDGWGFEKYKDSSADIAVRGSDGVLFHTVNTGNASATNPFSSTFGAGDTLGIAIDLDNFKFYFSVNGVWANNANPETGVGGIDISTSGTYFNGVQNANVLFFAGLMMFQTSVQVVQDPLYKPQGYSDC